MTAIRYHLGAEELIELGGPSENKVILRNRRPFLAGRVPAPRGMLGQSEEVYILDLLASVGSFLAEGLSFVFNTLGDIIDVPLGILAQGVDVAFNGVAGLLQNVPILGDLLAQVLLLGGSLVKFGLSIPGLALHGLGNVLGGIGKALGQKDTPVENQKKIDKAKNDVVNQAPDGLKDNVKKILDNSGVTGSNLTPGVGPDGQPLTPPVGTSTTPPGTVPGAPPPPAPNGKELETALAVGVPIVGAVALFAALT